MIRNHDGKSKTGMRSYTLRLSGLGKSQGFQEYGEYHAPEQVATSKGLADIVIEVGLDVFHITLVDIQNDTSDAHLVEYHKIVEEAGVELELDVSFNAPSDPCISCDVENSLHIAHKLGRNLVKCSVDVEHPEKPSHSYLTPSVMKQLAKIYGQFEKSLPLIEKCGMKITIENHCDLFADEVIWLVKQLNYPLAGVCCDTISSLTVMEGIAECIRKMASYCYCVHLRDNGVFTDPDGTHSLGAAIGVGNVDCRVIMDILREGAPDDLNTVDFEIGLPLPGYSIKEGREIELKDLCKSVEYIYKELGIGRNPAKTYGPSNYSLNR